MYCDFSNVTDILYRNRKSSKYITYNNIVNTLFGTYLKDNNIYEFPDYTLTKLHKGSIGVSPELKDYYQDAAPDKMKENIKSALEYIFDKPNTYHELYRLIQYDDTLSSSMRRSILSSFSVDFTDDSALIDLIYESIYIAVTRLYYKDEGIVAAKYFYDDLIAVDDVLFKNNEYVPPCKHFCGRSKELDELHAVVSDNSTVIITGVAGIGKSELVRAYAKDHRKEYQYFGYYFYGGSLKDIIANVVHDALATESDLNTRYQRNLELLSSLGEKALLIIDNYNVTPDEDECFDDVCDLKCKVIFTSHMRFEDYATYELRAFRHADDVKTLTKYFYQYKEDEWKCLLQIYGVFDMHTFCVELCAKAFTKGAFSPKTLYKNLKSFKIRDFAEKLSAKKDKHPKKKTYFDHIRELFNLLGLPERHKQVLRVMVFAPVFGFRKDFLAKIMNLKNMVIVEDLIDVGLLYENYKGRVNIQSVVAEVVRSELETNNETCSDFIETVRALCLNEENTIKAGERTILQMVAAVFWSMDFSDTDFQLRFVHDCFKFTEHMGESSLNDAMIAFEQNNHRESHELKTLYLSDAAAYEMIKKHLDNAIYYQMQAVECSKNCDNNVLLQANTVNTYGYYLNLADRKEDALKEMQIGLTLFDQLDGDGVFYFDKYRAIINYGDLLFSLGYTDEAIKQVSAAVSSLRELELQDTEVYADCIYSLGLYHVCVNDTSAGDELVSAFRIFIDLYGRDSDFVQTRAAELLSYIETAHINLTDYEPLKQLLGE
ncbi:ATP-binding protein [Ruminococcus sp. NK3A76]|uniref:ATP-binding protein n=1 Tax=Ruminococcus sp. NK3A76 TaxID=877411 RepID=UPI00048AE683|nr:ATP-binding protein [Ruminococcus sp. NK3A76]